MKKFIILLLLILSVSFAFAEATYINLDYIELDCTKYQNYTIPYHLSADTTSYSWEITFSDLDKNLDSCGSFMGVYGYNIEWGSIQHTGHRSGYFYSPNDGDDKYFCVCIGDDYDRNKKLYLFNTGKNTIHADYTLNSDLHNGTFSVWDTLGKVASKTNPYTGTWTGYAPGPSEGDFGITSCATYNYVSSLSEFLYMKVYEIKIWEGNTLKVDMVPKIKIEDGKEEYVFYDKVSHTYISSETYKDEYGRIVSEKNAPSVLYVSSSGSDSIGDGTVSNPYLTLTKAYSELNETGGTIALLSDISVNATLTLINKKNLILTSAKPNGTLITNSEGNYSGIHSIHRGSFTGDLFFLNNDSGIILKQIIVDGDRTEVSKLLINATSGEGNASVVMETNSILKDNFATADDGISKAGAIELGTQLSDYQPVLYMKSNAAIRGCKAPTHGGAITVNAGDVFMQDNSVIEYNGVDYASSLEYCGGGAIFADGGNLHLKNNAKISNNFVQLNGKSDFGRSHSSVVASTITDSKIYVSGNVSIFDNFDNGYLTCNDDDTYTLSGSKQSNSFVKTGSFLIEGQMGNNSKIGISVENGKNNDILATSNNYSLSDSDVNAFLDDNGTFRIVRSSNNLLLSSEITEVKLKIDSLNSIELEGSFDISFSPVANNFSLFRNGVKLEDGYFIYIEDNKFTVVFNKELEFNTVIGISVSKNGYKVNDGKIVERKYGHNHEWNFIIEGNTITAVCISDEYQEDCVFKNNQPECILSAAGSTILNPQIIPSTATNKKLFWTSSDASYVRVEQNGQLKAIRTTQNQIEITVHSMDEGNASCVCYVNVVN